MKFEISRNEAYQGDKTRIKTLSSRPESLATLSEVQENIEKNKRIPAEFQIPMIMDIGGRAGTVFTDILGFLYICKKKSK